MQEEIKKHTLIISQEEKYIFEAIKNGTKKIETRAGSVRYQSIMPGDVLTFSCDGEEFEKKVVSVQHFSSIPELFQKYSPEEINSRTHTVEDATEMYYSFPNYKEKIAEFGILAFELE